MKNQERLILATLILSIGLAGQVSSQTPFHGVIYGSDRGIQEAQWEIEQLPRRLPQYRNLKRSLFKRKGFYVSVILFPTKQDAYNALPIIENEYKRGSFVRPLNEWCPNWKNPKKKDKESGISYYDCETENKKSLSEKLG
ncbi:hypothetical protein D3800_10690 [Microcystis aeruginosa NIES-298]|uniref:Uncharacterized protein n=1 Tax=Microcystis aeruginosa NIES-298 TaxID=449468 RepID=A0A2H6BN46_MICAE|nr:hypothetical protein [Microcystis aeruginosa]QHU83755.1 hypothetical protein D3800_10690 [Microcystis aeruginosa NIES-298]GBD51607.1 hypothetical protein BGM30_07000 [Microcystis aeruginosa NIES-298]GBE98307.1 hypothetical protein NIES298_25550 [Microcystis aeruginosa NIES-298]